MKSVLFMASTALVNPTSLSVKKGVKSAVALTPALQPIDGVAVSYIDAAVALGNTINEMDKYYTQGKIIKTMRLRKGKRCTRHS